MQIAQLSYAAVQPELTPGIGSLLFTQPQPLWSRNRGWGAWDGMAIEDVPEFRDIDDVDGVYRLISDQREKSQHATQTV